MGRKIITGEKGRKTVRILIADDEEEMTQALSAIPGIMSIIRWIRSHDSLAALDYSMAESCDCLVLDIMMPGLDGLQVPEEAAGERHFHPVLLPDGKGRGGGPRRRTGLRRG